MVTEAGRRAVSVAGDIQDEAHCVSLVQQAIDAFGRLDILVNNAAFQNTVESIQDFAPDDLDRAFRTNIYAMFHLSKAALHHLPEGGTIVNTTSIQAYKPSASLMHYAATKGAIVTFTRILSEDALKQGVRVNAVAPGPVWTPLIVSTIPAEQHTEFGGQSPMGRPAQPAELAPSYIGEIIGVTGGTPLS